ncbi:MAG: TRAP transporter large permease [Alphaproteobacteria bacterium]|nr:TRAP transporter large permease [Alphaproteobacteria bacterium]
MLLLVFLLFLGLMAIGFDVGLSMVGAAALGMWLSVERPTDLVMVPLTMATGMDSAALVTVPLFILAGELMNQGGLTQRLIDWSFAMVGHLRGALSQVAIVTNLIMAGVSGSAVADAAATGGLLIPAMRKEGYDEGYAGAVIAAGALLGPIIPPSIPMIVYAVMANQSVIKLFLAGVVPGILLAAGYMAICAVIARRRGYAARPRVAWRGRLAATRSSFWALLMPVIILVGMRYGLVTDNEAAAVAAVYALVVGVGIYREIRGRALALAFVTAARGSAVILFLLAAAGPFGWLLAEARINDAVAALVLAQTHDPVVGLLLINAALLVIGCFIEPLPAMIIFLPALIPVGGALGIDPIHLGTVMVINLMIGMLTPPVGLLLFVVAAVGKVPLGAVIRAVLPFLGWSVIVLVLITLWPPLVTFLPNLGG